MKFQLVAPDHQYESGLRSGGINGGTVWLDNIAQALRWHGHDAELVSINHELDADYVVVQSEFIYFEPIVRFKERGGKVVCLLSHFTSTHPIYATMDRVKELSTHTFTMWEGKLLDGIDHVFIPHGYNDLVDDRVSLNRRGGAVFAGNTYNLRNESWIRGMGMFRNLKIDRIYKTLPKDLPPIYRAADVCINIHGDFQKDIVSQEHNRLSDKPGMMINERFWNVLGAGGLLITDWVPQMSRWFSQDELIVAHSREEFFKLVNYYRQPKNKEEGLNKIKTAIEKVRNEHTYRHRVAEMLKHLC